MSEKLTQDQIDELRNAQKPHILTRLAAVDRLEIVEALLGEVAAKKPPFTTSDNGHVQGVRCDWCGDVWLEESGKSELVHPMSRNRNGCAWVRLRAAVEGSK